LYDFVKEPSLRDVWREYDGEGRGWGRGEDLLVQLFGVGSASVFSA
jgi:hypothetical protein